MDSLNSRKRKKGDDEWGESSKRIPVDNRVVPINEESLLKLHITEDPWRKLELATTMFASFSDDEITSNQLCVNYCSMLNCFLPALDVIMNTFKYLGMKVHVVSTEAERQETGFVMEQPMSGPHAAISLGQSLLLLLKDVPTTNYEKYMENRIKAMKPLACIPSHDTVNPIMSFERAKIIRDVLGAAHVLKAPITRSLLSVTNRINCLSYIARILEFTEMTGLSFIYEILVLDRSPVLKDPSLHWEVRNVAQAFKVIHSTPYPRHFKLLFEPEKTRITERKRFPTLVAVAQSIKADLDPSARRFLGGKKDNDERVAALKVLHNDAPIDTATLNYLYGIDWTDSGYDDGNGKESGYDEEAAALDYLYQIVGMDSDPDDEARAQVSEIINPPNA